nr:hypothetical protein [uncultured Faecalicatena sp.]
MRQFGDAILSGHLVGIGCMGLPGRRCGTGRLGEAAPSVLSRSGCWLRGLTITLRGTK